MKVKPNYDFGKDKKYRWSLYKGDKFLAQGPIKGFSSYEEVQENYDIFINSVKEYLNTTTKRILIFALGIVIGGAISLLLF